MRTLISVLAAFFGVRSERERQRDFNADSPLPYILTGLLLIILFVTLLIVIVRFVTAST